MIQATDDYVAHITHKWYKHNLAHIKRVQVLPVLSMFQCYNHHPLSQMSALLWQLLLFNNILPSPHSLIVASPACDEVSSLKLMTRRWLSTRSAPVRLSVVTSPLGPPSTSESDDCYLTAKWNWETSDMSHITLLMIAQSLCMPLR